MAQGVLLIVCGPSGVGKTSLCDNLLKRRPRLTLSVSYTTRERRGEEEDGVDYHFVDEDQFQAMREAGEFAESAEVHGNWYGTSMSVIEAAWQRGRDLLFDIDYQGARQLKERVPTANAVLIAPPDLITLEERLHGRATDSDEVIEERLSAARHELAQYELFDHIVENDDFDRAAGVLDSIYVATRHERHIQARWLDEILQQ